MSDMDWDLEVGDEDTRTAIHARHRGSESRGISAPGRDSGLKNIMLWWRPEHGEGYGYADGWTTDGAAFYFTGTGQQGDQRFDAPLVENGRVRDHAANGDRIRLLRYTGNNQVRYVGELQLDPSDPWQWVDGPDVTGRTRRMIQFRFLPVDKISVPAADRVRRPPAPRAEEHPLQPPPPDPQTTDVEALKTQQFKRLLQARETLAERTESVLVHAFSAWLKDAHRLESTGLRIPYAAEGRNLRADLFITVPGVLVEAKATAARESVRMAIGQLLDYSRYMVPAPSLLLLTPTLPPEDMCALLDSLGIAYAWREEDGTFHLSSSATWIAV